MPPVERAFIWNLQAVLSFVPSVRNGDAEAIHDARVATRRLRAIVPILSAADPSEVWDETHRILKTTGRSLGRARDLDVAIELLDDLERRSPAAAPGAAAMRARLRAKQLGRRRKLIKRLEALELDSLLVPSLSRIDHLHGSLNGLPWRKPGSWGRPGSGRMLRGVIGEQAHAVQEAIDHASGVYFPKRAHAVRVSLKKLRYAVELLDDREPGRRAALRTLKSTQETLGQIHDREVLNQRLKSLVSKQAMAGADALADVLTAECLALFDQYRARRPEVRAICDALLEWARPPKSTGATSRMLKVGAVALPSAAVVLLANRSHRAR